MIELVPMAYRIVNELDGPSSPFTHNSELHLHNHGRETGV